MRKISSLILILCLLAAVIPAASGEAAAMNAVAIAREAVSAVFPAMSLPGDADWTVVPDEDGCLAQCTSAEGYAVSSFIDLSEDGYAVQTSFSISIPEDAEILKIWKDWTDADGESEDPEAVRAEYAPGAINATLAYVNGLGFNSAAFSLYEDLMNTDGSCMLLIGFSDSCEIFMELADVICQEQAGEWDESMGSDMQLIIRFTVE